MPDHRALSKTRHKGIFRRPSGVYVVIVRTDDGKQVKRSAPTERAALDLQAKLRLNKSEPQAADSPLTVAEYVQEWLRTYTGRTSKRGTARTVANYRSTLERNAVPFLGS